MSFKNGFLLFLVVIVVIAIALFTWQENQKPKDKISLKLKLNAGASHDYKIIYTGKTTYKINNQQEKANLQGETIIGFDVLTVDANGIMNVEISYKNVKFNADIEAQHIRYDSTNIKPAESNDLFQKAIEIVYSAMIGSKLKIEVDQFSKASDIKGFENIRAKIKEKLNSLKSHSVVDANTNNNKNKAVVQKLQEVMIENARLIKLAGLCESVLPSVIRDTHEMIDDIVINFPDRTVSSGGKWRNKSYLNLGLDADANTTYTFKKREKGDVYIEAVSELDMGKNFKITEINSSGKILRRMSGIKNSLKIVDEASGLLRKSETNINFSGVERREPDKLIHPLRLNMMIPITIEDNMTIELIK